MKQIVKNQQRVKQEQKYKRECKGRALALTRSVYRLVNSDVFYVQSESSNDLYYFVKFKPDVIEFCSCLDSSTRRNVRCKHSFGVEYAIRLGTLKDIDRLPTEAKVSKQQKVVISIAQPPKKSSISYKDDEYSF